MSENQPSEPMRSPFEAVEQLENLLASFETLAKSALKLPGISEDKSEFVQHLLRILKLTVFYIKETNRCLSVNAFFSANVMGAAALESLLLLRCLTSAEDVQRSVAWKSSHKSKSLSYVQQLGHMNLKTLLLIAYEMAWITRDRVPITLRELLGQHIGVEMTESLCNVMESSGQLAAESSNDARNKLHADRCIREPFELSDDTGLFAFVCLVSALGSFADQQKLTKTP